MAIVADFQAGPRDTNVELARGGDIDADLTFNVRSPINDEALLSYMLNGQDGQTYTIDINGVRVVDRTVDTNARHAAHERITPGVLRDGENTVHIVLTSQAAGTFVIHDLVLFYHRDV